MTGLFQPFKNVPISPPASINASPRVSEDDLEAESGDVTRARPGYNTMMHLLSDRRAELQLFGSETQMSKLQDLSNLMFTRGRLQELGCTFSEVGKLLTYGDPSSLKEWDRLLRLGPIYDEQWALFFPAPLGQQDNDTADMWSDLRTLKRVLANDGVAFGGRHRRLTRGDRSGKLLRLCAAYDDLYKLWSASVTERGSKRAMTSVDERQENGSNGSFGDSRSSMNKRHGQAQAFPGASVGRMSRSLRNTRPDPRARSRGTLAGALATTLIRPQLPATAIQWIMTLTTTLKRNFSWRTRYLLSSWRQQTRLVYHLRFSLTSCDPRSDFDTDHRHFRTLPLRA
jgi:hypothetical protein